VGIGFNAPIIFTMKLLNQVAKYVRQDGIVKRGNIKSINRTIELTYHELLRLLLKKYLITGHDDFTNFFCIHKDNWEKLFK